MFCVVVSIRFFRDDKQVNRIAIHLQQTNDHLIFDCSNSYEMNGTTREGIGLSNVTRRLELLYPGRYTLDIGQAGGFYTVHLTLAT